MEAPRELLTDADKQFITENYRKMSVYQIAIRLNIKTESGGKCPIITEFIDQAGLNPASPAPAPVVAEVKVDKTMEQAIDEIVNEKMSTDDVTVDEKDHPQISIEAFTQLLKGLKIEVREPPSEKEKRDMIFLLNQMQSKRFLLTYRSYVKKDYKDLFQEEFIRAMYGKGDMPQEEVNDFIDLCNEVVFQYDVKCKVKDLDKLKNDKNTTTQQRIVYDSMILELNDKHTNSTKRTSEIKRTLGANREQRLRDSKPTGVTIVALLDSFYNYEKRQEFAKIQENKDEKIRKAILMIDEMDEAKALILGISPDELMNGGL